MRPGTGDGGEVGPAVLRDSRQTDSLKSSGQTLRKCDEPLSKRYCQIKHPDYQSRGTAGPNYRITRFPEYETTLEVHDTDRSSTSKDTRHHLLTFAPA